MITCKDSRPCYKKEELENGRIVCILLNDGYEDGKCPFAKAKPGDPSYATITYRQLRTGSGKIG